MRILIVEDEASLSRALKVILEKNKYSVDTANNGLDAYDFIKGSTYDALILDLMIPKLDGVSLIKRIRKEGLSVPILVLSAKSEVDDKVTALDSGANDYLTKPFATNELLARLRALTRVSGQGEASSIVRGNTKLDLKTYELTSALGSYRLTNKEFQILELFFRRPGQMISSEYLISQIWGYDSSSDISTVWVYISYLRKKLLKLGSNVEIKATRGAGYYLEERDERQIRKED